MPECYNLGEDPQEGYEEEEIEEETKVPEEVVN